MTKHRTLSIVTKYWKPGQDYVQEIVRAINGKVADGDIIVISEKAISTALNNIVDESTVAVGMNAKFIATFWMRVVWGYVLGPMCRLNRRLMQQIRHYPIETGSRHKQIAIQQAGLFQALMFGSEGGIDGSNMPYAYVSLPLKNAILEAEKIHSHVQHHLGKKAGVMIVDTDKTYSFVNFHFTPRPGPMKGIYSMGGLIAYIFGRFLKLKKRSTPLALEGCRLNIEEALNVAEIANRARGFGAGRTVWEMAERFKVSLTGVSWEMLSMVKHKPVVIVRSKR